ncbi:hypothetical protein LCGC14_1989840 [marine sediment metagenome]|uniref:Uncharacterized protein n=1 Tax=marine sediment metagenome TaxID=412755 RepID=A0A0F9HJQ7_9ZZZZ
MIDKMTDKEQIGFFREYPYKAELYVFIKLFKDVVNYE